VNCDRARDLLPLDLYGDLGPDEVGELREHLAGCSACRKEREGLDAARRALDAAPDPLVAVDTARIHREAAARHDRTLRRWRRCTLAAAALAAGLLLVLLVRPEIVVGGGQFVVRWGDRPAPPPLKEPTVTVVQVPAPAERDVELAERVRLLGDLVRALREDVETGDRARREQIDLLVARLEVLRLQSLRRWDETRRDVTALYTAQFGKRDPGDER
jgi:hypothetical protein